MQTVQLDIQDDKMDIFLNIVNNLKNGIVEKVRFEDDLLDVENIEKNTSDHFDIEQTKKENNPKYSLEEAKAKLGL